MLEGRFLLLGLVALAVVRIHSSYPASLWLYLSTTSLLTPDKSGGWSALRAQRNYLAAQHPEGVKTCACPFPLNQFCEFGERNSRCEPYLPEKKTDMLNNLS